MFASIRGDFRRYQSIEARDNRKNILQDFRIWQYNYSLQVLAAFRLYTWGLSASNALGTIFRFPVMLIGFLLLKFLGRVYDIRISDKAVIGPSFYIGHFGGVRVGACRIGGFCSINHQVVVGEFPGTVDSELAIIGDRVWIGSYSKIKAGAQVGPGATVAAGTTVSEKVPERTLAVGPTCILLRKDFDNAYLLGL